ncbi:MAG: putative sulfate exporter family transporter [Chloroflexi bacterium]|nr:putative sulfate exporter family transporter [Chloroflexota bacterium]
MINYKSWANRISCLAPGLLVTLALAVIAFITWWFLRDAWIKFSALLWAFIYSIVIIAFRPALSEGKFNPGVEFSSTTLLRWSIALLGLTVSASVWVKMGSIGLAIVLINMALVFSFGIVFCKYILKLDNALSLLISVGTSVCGASAIAAVGPALKAKAEQMGLSVAVITLFGLLAMFLYPLLFAGLLADWLANNHLAYGMWVGTGVHETAQVIAAASQVNHALSTASSAKFIRIFTIGPMVFISLFLFHRFSRTTESRHTKITVPWFALFFVIFSLTHFVLESLPIRDIWLSLSQTYLTPATTFLLAWSFAAVGLKVKISSIRAVGLKAFLGGLTVAIFAGVVSLILVRFLWLPFNS